MRVRAKIRVGFRAKLTVGVRVRQHGLELQEGVRRDPRRGLILARMQVVG